jgi:hypothetical protein
MAITQAHQEAWDAFVEVMTHAGNPAIPPGPATPANDRGALRYILGRARGLPADVRARAEAALAALSAEIGG